MFLQWGLQVLFLEYFLLLVFFSPIPSLCFCSLPSRSKPNILLSVTGQLNFTLALTQPGSNIAHAAHLGRHAVWLSPDKVLEKNNHNSVLMGIWDDIRKTFKNGSSLTRLIYINIAVFLLISVGSIIGYLLNNQTLSLNILNLFSVPSSFKALLSRPWTLITYMFTHKDILHILFNMLWLYWFGTIFLEYLDQKKLVAVYLLGGICGAVVYIISFNIFPAFNQVVNESVAIGASASVMAVVVAIAAYVPDYSVNLFLLGRIKIK